MSAYYLKSYQFTKELTLVHLFINEEIIVIYGRLIVEWNVSTQKFRMSKYVQELWIADLQHFRNVFVVVTW